MAVPNMKELISKFRSVTENLQKLSECQVCLEHIKVPFKLCARGHMMCNSCVKTLKVCPTCEAEFSIENPTGVRSILEALPKFCRYSSDGCQNIVDSGDDHETHCGYRPETCRYQHCKLLIPLCKFVEHYKSNHIGCILNEIKDTLIWKEHDPNKHRHCNIPVSIYGHLFWLVLTNDLRKKQFIIKFEIVPLGKVDEDYYVCVKFGNGNFNYTYTLKALMSIDYDEDNEEVNAREKSYDTDSEEDHDREFLMKVPLSVLDQFINKEKTLIFELKFFNTKM